MAARSATEFPRRARREERSTYVACAAVACAALLVLACRATRAQASPTSTVAAHTWTEVSTPHVIVLTDAGREAGERVADRLENLRTVLSLAAPALVADVAPVQVLLFRDAALSENYAPRWRGQRDQVSGLFQNAPDRRRLLFLDDPTRTPAVAQHEYTHALLDAAMPATPLWLNEGLAEYFSTFTAEGDRAQAGTPVKMHLDWLAEHDLMPLPELFAIDQASTAYHEGDRRGTFYAQSWLLTHMILSGTDDDLGRLERVLVSARDGEPFARAFGRVFGDELSLRDRLATYLERLRFNVREWRLSRPLGTGGRHVRERVSPAEVLGSLGIALLARPTPEREEAEAHLRAALALDPGSPDACAGMGWLLVMRQQRNEAIRWFTRALERTPVSVPAVQLMATELLLDVSQRGPASERPAIGALVRDALARAQAVTPDDPELEALLARSYALAPGDDPTPGWEHAVRAARALPGRPDVLLDQLELAALTGREALAQQLFDTHFRTGATPEVLHAARAALFAGDVRAVNQLLKDHDLEGAEQRLVAARARAAGDAAVQEVADRFLEELRKGRARQLEATRETDRENTAIGQYNDGVKALEGARYGDAAAAFRSAAAGSGRATFREQALRMALRMDLRVRGERAWALAHSGDVAHALAVFRTMDRTSMNDEDRRWVESSITQLERMRGR